MIEWSIHDNKEFQIIYNETIKGTYGGLTQSNNLGSKRLY